VHIRSKFDARCRTCGQPIHRGELIYWAPGEGGHHISCESKRASSETANAQQVVQRPVGKFGVLDWIIVLIPLGLGPALVLMDTSDAVIDFLVLPYVASMLNGGFKRTGGSHRVKWSSRPQYKVDLSASAIFFMAALSMIPGGILWLVLKLAN
jgi:hypothetical protein